MKYFLHTIFLCFILNTVSAQEKHFVFIQSDNKQPFYVSLNGKLYSSTASGYVIIPKLTDGEYSFTIGFAANSFPEQKFNYTINKDVGFDLKNFGDKGWGLFNLQTLNVTMAGEVKPSDVAKVEKPKEEYKPEISFERRKDPPVTQPETKTDKPVDSSTANGIAASSTVPVPVETQTQKTGDVTNPQNTAGQKTIADVPPAKASDTNESVANGSNVKKIAEEKDKKGVYLTYVDYSDKSKDTVQIIIPVNEKSKAVAESSVVTDQTKLADNASNTNNSANNNPPTNNSSNVGSNNSSSSSSTDLKFLNMDVSRAKTDTASMPVSAPGNVAVQLNSNCKNAATDQDVARLRRRMSSESNDESKIDDAKRIFRNKCFTTSQIKDLSTLFLSDEGRYKFFDASYDFVTDAQSYSSLEKEFIDPYFINRFKAMLRK